MPSEFGQPVLNSNQESHTQSWNHRGRSKPSGKSKILEGLVNICLSSSLRFNLLRVICLAALLAFLHDIHITQEYKHESLIFILVLGPSVLVRHFASAFGPTLALPAILDISLSLAEVVLVSYSLHYHHPASVWSTPQYLWSFVCWLIVLASAILMLLVRCVDNAIAFGQHNSIRRRLLRRYDFTRTRERFPRGKQSELAQQNIERPGVFYVIAGTRLWVPLFNGEMPWVVYFRGILTFLIISAMVMYTFFNLILNPVQETGVVPVKEQHSVALPNDFRVTRQTVWNVVVQRQRDASQVSQQDQLLSAVSVTPLWRKPEGGPPCEAAQDLFFQTQDFDFVTFHCPSSRPIPAKSANKLLPLPYQVAQPDLLITVNFSLLGIPSDTLEDIPLNSVQITLGMTNKTENVVRTTPPTTLVPGINLVGIASLAVRQQFSAPGLSAFGLVDVFETFLVAEMKHVWQDPRASGSSTSDLILQGEDVGTMRVSLQSTPTVYKIVQEYRDKSILRGFATVGGLWTFFGGVFSALFGSSLMRFFFGNKPISIYGLAHAFQRTRLKEACVTDYPRIQRELNASPEERGMLNLLCNHLIDLDFLITREERYGPLSSRSNGSRETSPDAKDSLELHPYTPDSKPTTNHILVRNQVHEVGDLNS